jgi:hypothetical protein
VLPKIIIIHMRGKKIEKANTNKIIHKLLRHRSSSAPL